MIDIYVNSITGSDSNDGSIGHPYLTINKAWSMADPIESTIHLAIGVYTLTQLAYSAYNITIVGEGINTILIFDPGYKRCTGGWGYFDFNSNCKFSNLIFETRGTESYANYFYLGNDSKIEFDFVVFRNFFNIVYSDFIIISGWLRFTNCLFDLMVNTIECFNPYDINRIVFKNCYGDIKLVAPSSPSVFMENTVITSTPKFDATYHILETVDYKIGIYFNQNFIMSKLDLSNGNGGRSGERTYIAPNGVTVNSTARVWINNGFYYMGNMFNGSILSYSDGYHYWLSEGAATLTFDFGAIINWLRYNPIKTIVIYPKARDEASSNYQISVSEDGINWTIIVPWVIYNNPPYGMGFSYEINTSKRYLRIQLSQNGNWGSILDEIEFYTKRIYLQITFKKRIKTSKGYLSDILCGNLSKVVMDITSVVENLNNIIQTGGNLAFDGMITPGLLLGDWQPICKVITQLLLESASIIDLPVNDILLPGLKLSVLTSGKLQYIAGMSCDDWLDGDIQLPSFEKYEYTGLIETIIFGDLKPNDYTDDVIEEVHEEIIIPYSHYLSEGTILDLVIGTTIEDPCIGIVEEDVYSDKVPNYKRDIFGNVQRMLAGRRARYTSLIIAWL